MSWGKESWSILEIRCSIRSIRQYLKILLSQPFPMTKGTSFPLTTSHLQVSRLCSPRFGSIRPISIQSQGSVLSSGDSEMTVHSPFTLRSRVFKVRSVIEEVHIFTRLSIFGASSLVDRNPRCWLKVPEDFCLVHNLVVYFALVK